MRISRWMIAFCLTLSLGACAEEDGTLLAGAPSSVQVDPSSTQDVESVPENEAPGPTPTVRPTPTPLPPPTPTPTREPDSVATQEPVTPDPDGGATPLPPVNDVPAPIDAPPAP